MAELIIIIAVIIIGGLAYWAFGDPDRSERLLTPILSMNGRYYRMIMIIFWGLQAVISFYKSQFLWGIIWLLLMVYLVIIYVKERVQR